jgi:phosphate acyltransferase
MRIALDAMGSDTCPVPDVAGAVIAAREYGDTIILVGDETRVRAELGKHDTAGLSIEVVHAPDAVTMEDKPSTVGKLKPESSMHVGMNLVRDGGADAFVTAGNTGAALSIATLFTLRRIRGVKRPALSTVITLNGRSIICADVGANADCKPDWMLQFAIMARAYARFAFSIDNPRVALLSNGEEEGKGTDLIRESARLLEAADLNFIGNVEPKDLFKGGVDVVVADGFVGNILIKTMEASTSTLIQVIRGELTADLPSKLGALLARPAFRRVRKAIDPFETGGAPLLGVDGVVIIGHGRSNANAIKNAIRQARTAVQGNLIAAIREGVSSTAEPASEQA